MKQLLSKKIWYLWDVRLTKINRIMKLTFFLLLAACLHISAAVHSQGKDFTFSFHEASLHEVFTEIMRHSSYFVLYNNEKVNTERNNVSTSFRHASIDEVLSKVLAGTSLHYKIIDRTIVISRGETQGLPLLQISGNIVDATTGEPLPGVTIRSKLGGKGTISDDKGVFSLEADSRDSLTVSYIGYQPVVIPVSGRENIRIDLNPSRSGLNEIVVVGYGTQKKSDLTAAISSINGNQLTAAPVANISNTLGGRLSGILSRQSSGEPGDDADEIRIRGIGTTGDASPLVVVDGIPMNYDQLDPNEVASVTILKDAAAVAPYGLAGANGVIVITTKRGQEGKFSFNYDGYYGWQRPTAIPDYLDAYGYASSLNKANENVGNQAPYTNEQLQKFKDGSDPDHYPNTNWIQEIVNFHAPVTRHSLSFSGGTAKLRMYGNLGYLYQEGTVSVINFKRYNATVNTDADVTPTTTLSVNINTIIAKKSDPAATSGSGIYTSVTEIPAIFPLQYSNGKPAHQLLPAIYQGGYDKNTNNLFNGQLQIAQQIPFIPGLSLKGVYSYQKGYAFGKTWSLPMTFYSLNAQDEYSIQKVGPPAPTLGESFTQNQVITLQGYLTYKRRFGKHDIDLLGVYESRPGMSNQFSASRINYAVDLDELSLGSSNKNDFDNSGSSARSAQIGWVYRLNYGYADKYLLGLSGRYDGHYYFAPGKRFAFFPAVSLGWRISEEPFLKSRIPGLDNLKIRGSYGKSGNLAGGPFQYLTAYGLGDSYVFGGSDPVQVQGIYENAQPNTEITWETAQKADIGIDADLWKEKVSISLDVFKEKRSNMLLKPTSTIPAEYGIGISQINAGIMENSGFDFSASLRRRFSSGLQLNASLNFSYAKNKLIQTFESAATYDNPNRRQTGRAWQTQFGLKALGLYHQSDFNADGSLKNGEAIPTYGAVQPGDIKYADLSGPEENGKMTGPDGKIDINDYTAIGKPLFPEIIYGLNLGLGWKGIDLNMLWQGAAAANIYLADELAYPFYNGATIAEYQTNYWTPEHTNAQFPRLTPSPTTNNSQISSFWVRNGSYLRLKTLELGYSLPRQLCSTIKLQEVRVYLSGENLLTFTQFKYIDPELGNNRGRYYFQQKTFAFGLNIGF